MNKSLSGMRSMFREPDLCNAGYVACSLSSVKCDTIGCPQLTRHIPNRNLREASTCQIPLHVGVKSWRTRREAAHESWYAPLSPLRNPQLPAPPTTSTSSFLNHLAYIERIFLFTIVLDLSTKFWAWRATFCGCTCPFRLGPRR
jgi:hypothetical protein